MTIEKSEFGLIQVGDYRRPIYAFKLIQKNASVTILSYGGTIQAINVPDRSGNVVDVTLGFDNQEGYFGSNNPYFGSTVGRVANRIANGKIKVGEVSYNIAANAPPNTLHGGFHGLDKKLWEPMVDGEALILTCVSDHLEEGFPGYLETRVIYEFTPDFELKMTFKAKSTLPTPVNITNHAYFNLAGQGSGSQRVYEHDVYLNADSYTPTDSQSIPLGEIANVKGTPLDFTTSKNLGSAIKGSPDNGFDNNYCVNDYGKGLRLAARASHQPSGRVLEVFSDQPGIQFYTGNFLNNIIGKKGAVYNRHDGFCFESQNYPNAVNIPCFPNSILDPAHEYVHNIIYKFSLQN